MRRGTVSRRGRGHHQVDDGGGGDGELVLLRSGI
uniref:Uncharacterized protein n=1 Tax=Anguilla anguilla TaxID=7936 RepID=A0A0E9V3U4_ANGAN